MSLATNNEGKIGEDFAASYLLRHGFTIIDRNFRIRGGEIDIIALDGKTLVFVEVKTRTSHEYGTPLEAIGYHKLKSLIKTAYVYKTTHPRLPGLMRIDAVAVMLDPENRLQTIELVKNIS